MLFMKGNKMFPQCRSTVISVGPPSQQGAHAGLLAGPYLAATPLTKLDAA